MSAGRVLDRTFQIYRTHFVMLAGIGLPLPAVLLLLQLVFIPLGYPPPSGTAVRNPLFFWTKSLEYFSALLLVYMIAQAITAAATVYAVSKLHLGEAVSIAESYRKTLSRLGSVLRIAWNIFLRLTAAAVIAYIACVALVVGLVALTEAGMGGAAKGLYVTMAVILGLAPLLAGFLWMLHLYASYCLAVPACLVENIPARPALKRSRFLARGSIRKIILIYVLMFVLGLTLSTIFWLPGQFYGIFHGHSHVISVLLRSSGSFFAGVLSGPISTIAVALIYYDQRIRKEAFDLQRMMESMGQPTPASPPEASLIAPLDLTCRSFMVRTCDTMQSLPQRKMPSMDSTLRPMSTSQVLDRTFHLYRNHFVLFAGIAVITPALHLISQLVQLKIFGPVAVPRDPASINGQFFSTLIIRVIVSVLVGSIIYLIGTAMASSATAYAVSMVHLGKTSTIAEAYSKVKPIFLRILWLLTQVIVLTAGPLMFAYVLFLGMIFAIGRAAKSGGQGIVFLAVGGGLIGLVVFLAGLVWMVFAFCRYALAVPACTLENMPAGKSIKRSRFLTNGAKWSILGIALLTWLIGFILTYLLQLPALIAGHAVIITARTHLGVVTSSWIYFAQFLGGTLCGPITTIALVLVYYDQRVRKEAFDLQLLMEAMGEANSASPATAAASGAIG